jgi:hypothetical protein
MEQIVIHSDLDIQYSDLMSFVDFRRLFSLKDLLRIAVSSRHIPVEQMRSLVKCEFIQDFFDEAESNPYDPPTADPISHIVLLPVAETFMTAKGSKVDEFFWDMCGYRPKTKSLVSLNTTPTYCISNLPVRLGQQTEWHIFKEQDVVESQNLDFSRPITLLEL